MTGREKDVKSESVLELGRREWTVGGGLIIKGFVDLAKEFTYFTVPVRPAWMGVSFMFQESWFEFS